jgi:hypothetical protein
VNWLARTYNLHPTSALLADLHFCSFLSTVFRLTSLCASVRDGLIVSVKIITSLTNYSTQDVKPSSSCSLGRSGTVKDFKWLNHASSSAYIVLSNGGLLCHGTLTEDLQDLMDHVDAGSCLFLLLIPVRLNLRHVPSIAAMSLYYP